TALEPRAAGDHENDRQEGKDCNLDLPVERRREKVDEPHDGGGNAEPDEEDAGEQKLDDQQQAGEDPPDPEAESRKDLRHDIARGGQPRSPVLGTVPDGRGRRRGSGCLTAPAFWPLKASRAISAMPAMEPIIEDASSGSISTF